MTAKPRLVVDIVADPVCPWCFVGLNSFLRAKQSLSEEFEIIPRWRAYQLNPDTPPEGADRKAYYREKFPDENYLNEARARIKETGEAAGAPFDPGTPTRLPNTIRAHQVLRWAHFEGLQEKVALALYRGFWENDEDLGDVETLARLAGEAGMDKEKTRARLEAGEDEAVVRGEAQAFRAAGVSGVPTFIVNERTGFSGALPPDQLAAALRKAARG
jgi:predicted DsbA family dithiol-disulfide isomerase